MLEYINIKNTSLTSSRIALGTWAIGGWMWGGTDEKESIRTIHAALDHGINLIDTAPIYGYGRAEEIVVRALRQYGHRESIILATKVGIDWTNGRIERNSTRQRTLQELEDSLRRLETDYIDIYQVHRTVPDDARPRARCQHRVDRAASEPRDESLVYQSVREHLHPVCSPHSGTRRTAAAGTLGRWSCACHRGKTVDRHTSRRLAIRGRGHQR